jgi:hypothetical protein
MHHDDYNDDDNGHPQTQLRLDFRKFILKDILLLALAQAFNTI